jgi:pimeloyl-ACP methyl ester carboxylesterase
VQNFKSITLRNGPLEFSALEMGSGPLVLCLHGFPDCARSYRHQLPALAEAGYRAVSVTLRGYEPSSLSAQSSYTLAELAGDVVACLDQLGVERAHLVGHDWGAAISYAVGAKAPARFKSLTVMAVAHPGRFIAEIAKHPRQLRLSWYMAFFQLRGLSDYIVKRKDFAFIKKLWRDWSPGWDYPQEEMEYLIDELSQPGVLRAALGYYRAALSPKALLQGKEARESEKLSVPVPTLALTGVRDGCIDSNVFQKMMYQEDFPQGLEVRQISDAGHFPHQEQPEVVNALLLDWLQKHDE